MSVVRAATSPATAAEVAGWWAMLTGVWLMTISSFNLEDFVVAVACALPCAVAARLARAAVGGRWRFRAAWLAWILPLLRSAILDAVRVAAAVARHRPGTGEIGQLSETSLPAGEDRTAAAGREGLAELTLSTTPGSFVVHGDPDELVVHCLPPGTPKLAETVSR